MQFKFDMPVLLSAYPQAQAMTNYEFGEDIDNDARDYRLNFNKNYLYNKFISRPAYMKKIRAVVPEKYHKELLDDYDQDHALFLSEGTKYGLFQSIMMKPQNVQVAWPIRSEKL